MDIQLLKIEANEKSYLIDPFLTDNPENRF